MQTIDLNKLAKKAFEEAKAKGFHDKELSDEHCLCLVISELIEAVEADRCNRYSSESSAMFKEAVLSKETYDRAIKGSVEEELADAFIRLLDLAGLRNIEINIDDFDVVDMDAVCEGESFTESIFYLIKYLTDNSDKTEKAIKDCMTGIIGLTNYMKINLKWYVESKMRYNKTREYRHGKNY